MFRAFFRAVLQTLPGSGPAAAALFGIAAGLVVAVSFRLFLQRATLRELRRRMWAHVLELRLFGDEPALALASLFHIVAINARMAWRALPPLVIAAPVVAWLAAQLNDYYHPSPLQSGHAAVLTVRLRDGRGTPRIEIPTWIEIDSPPVHTPRAHEISWRLRAMAPGFGVCRISIGGETVTKELDSRRGLRYSGRVRARGWLDAWAHPAEERLPDGPIERIWISRDPQPLSWAGLTMVWWEWFAAAASIAAWLFSIPLARLGPG